ncbi:hypothetical protein H0266_10385 [Halobacillus locisalis]|uniref:Uncharacterized protein n=1 Tax=Halobacillus locisalis TaxID=220753 RepID=A0A838CTU1_9BACI|nr:hypothetical protein [Halobacillus locisalis]MBA2175303.1 hypothetical protein [Halobacillus locisalis]
MFVIGVSYLGWIEVRDQQKLETIEDELHTTNRVHELVVQAKESLKEYEGEEIPTALGDMVVSTMHHTEQFYSSTLLDNGIETGRDYILTVRYNIWDIQKIAGKAGKEASVLTAESMQEIQDSEEQIAEVLRMLDGKRSALENKIENYWWRS